MEQLHYLKLDFAKVTQQEKLRYLSGIKSVMGTKVKSMYELIKAVLAVTDKDVSLEVCESDNIYKFVIGSKLKPVTTYFYMPVERRLDIYTPDNLLTPFFQVKNKKVVHKGYSLFLDKLGLDLLFSRFINLL